MSLNPILARRRFLFGAAAVAAPAIIGVDRVMKFFTPPKLNFWIAEPIKVVTPSQMDLVEALARENEIAGVHDAMRLDVSKFRAIVEPVLRQHFEEAYRRAGIEDALAAYHRRLYDRSL